MKTRRPDGVSYRSSPLNLSTSCDCGVCRFVRGEEVDEADLFAVIAALDDLLAKSERTNAGLLQSLVALRCG